MAEFITGGGFMVARKIFQSEIWLKPPLYLKTWFWAIGRASFADHEKNGQTYQRGEFVTTYDEIIKATAYYYNRQHVAPTIKQIRIILKWLESERMIRVKPIKDSERPAGTDPRVRTRAYVGIKVSVVNYSSYQTPENYKGRHRGRPSVQLGHNNNNGTIMDTNISADLYAFYLQEISPQQKTRQRALANISHHLKKYPAEDLRQSILNYQSVASSREPHFRKDPSNFFGKREKYFIDFLRDNFETKMSKPKGEGTGSALLDAFYANDN
jgi:hypothetical protein